MRCEDAMRAAARLTEPDAGQADPMPDAALAHVLACPSCLARLDQLARATLSGRDGEISCAECRGRLPRLRELPDAGPPRPVLDAGSSAWWVATLTHLRRCPDCEAELLSLDAVMGAWETDRLPALESVPVFDLSFLEAPASEAGVWRPAAAAAAAGARVQRLVSELVIALEQGAARFGSLPGGLVPGPAPLAGALRDAGEAPAEQVQLSDPAADLSLRLVLGPTAGEQAVIGLSLHRPAADLPLVGARVVLYGAESELLASALTAEDGGLQFRGLGAGRYLIEIRRPEGRWQLPLVVEEGSA